LTKRLQGADLGFDAGEGLWQVLLWEAFDQLAGTLTVGFGEGPNCFEGQSQGAQALDHLHTPHRFFPKQAVVALAAAQGGEEPQVFVGAQGFDRHASASGELSDRHRMRS